MDQEEHLDRLDPQDWLELLDSLDPLAQLDHLVIFIFVQPTYNKTLHVRDLTGGWVLLNCRSENLR